MSRRCARTSQQRWFRPQISRQKQVRLIRFRFFRKLYSIYQPWDRFFDILTLQILSPHLLFGSEKIHHPKRRRAGPVGSQAHCALNCLPKADELFIANLTGLRVYLNSHCIIQYNITLYRMFTERHVMNVVNCGPTNLLKSQQAYPCSSSAFPSHCGSPTCLVR